MVNGEKVAKNIAEQISDRKVCIRQASTGMC